MRSCYSGHFEIAKWLHSIDVTITVNDYSFRFSCTNGHLEIVKWLLELDPTIISDNIKNLRQVKYDKLGISAQSAILFECIRNGTDFPEITEIDDCILYSLKHYNMISHLNKLSLQFPYIFFDVTDGKITEFVIEKIQMKSARNS